jgi:hypothetical protein
MKTVLLLALITQIGIPELEAWLRSLHGGGTTTLTDADVLAKLATDTKFIEEIGAAWLAQHPK